MQAPRRLQLRRGNTAAVSTYLGAPGELIVNTDNNTLIVHDGTTVGGVPATVNTSAITSDISSLQLDVATLTANAGAQAGSIATLTSNAAVQAGLIADLTANAGAQAGAIVTANTAMKGYVDAAVAGIVIPEVYGNANVEAYLTTNQYATQTYVNTANTAMKGYVDGQISSVNSVWQANAGAQAGSIATLTANAGAQAGSIATLTANAGAQAGSIATLTSNAAVQAGLIATLQSDVTTLTANAGAQAGSIATLTSNAATQAGQISDLQSNAATQAGLIASLNFYNDSNVSTYLGDHTAKTFGGNVSIQGNLFVNGNISYVNTNSYVVSDNIVQFADSNPDDSLDLGFVAHRTVAGTLQHTGLVRDASDGRWKLFSNVVPQVGTTVDFTNAVYDELVLGNISSPTITNITSNLGAVSGSLATLTANAGAQAGLIADLQSNAAVQAGDIATLFANAGAQAGSIATLTSNAASQAGDIANIYANLGSVSGSLATLTSNAAVQAGLLAGLEANAATQSGQIVTANTAMKGYVDAANTAMKGYVDSVSSNTSYGNANVGAYLTTYTGNIGNVLTTANVVTTQYFIGNGALLTGIVASAGTTYSNTNVAAYLATANITTTGNITAAWLSGNISLTGNVQGTSPNVTIVAGSYSSTFNNQGNVILPNVAVSGNVISGGYFLGNGALLTGIVSGGGTTYSNTNVAAYLTTYSGNIGNVSTTANVVTTGYFLGNGALLTGIVTSAGTTYSNSNVASYLPTYSGNVSAAFFIGNITNPTGNVYTVGNAIIGVSGYTVLPTTIAQFTGNANTYTQLNVQNISTGTDATSEYVATANNGSDTTFFVDMGIANSNYDVNSPNNSLGTTIFPNDSYLYAQGNTAATTGGNLAIGTTTANKTVKIFAGGINSANIVATVANTGVSVTGNVSATGNVTAGNVTASGNVTATYLVTTGGFGNISQVDTITANSMIATGNVTVQGMGVVMSNRPAFRVNGVSTNGGAQSTANTNLKGSAVSTIYNQGSHFNSTTGIFTAPIAGIYEVLLNARINSSFNGLAQLVVLKNGLNSSGNIVAFWETTSNVGTATHFGVSGTINLVAGDYLSANILAGNLMFDANDNWSVTYLG